MNNNIDPLKELQRQREVAVSIILDQLSPESRGHVETVLEYSSIPCKLVGIAWLDGKTQAVVLLEEQGGFRWQEMVHVKKELIATLDILALFGPMVSHLAWLDRQIDKLQNGTK